MAAIKILAAIGIIIQDLICKTVDENCIKNISQTDRLWSFNRFMQIKYVEQLPAFNLSPINHANKTTLK